MPSLRHFSGRTSGRQRLLAGVDGYMHAASKADPQTVVDASYSVKDPTCEPRKGCFITGSGPYALVLGSLLLQGMSQQDRSFASA